MFTKGIDRLGSYMRQRRGAVSQEAVAKMGGPSTTIQSQIENGSYAGVLRPVTRAKIDRGLRWEPGSASRVLEGGEPTPMPGWPPAPERAEPSSPASGALRFGIAAYGTDLTQLPDELLAEHWVVYRDEQWRAVREFARRHDIYSADASTGLSIALDGDPDALRKWIREHSYEEPSDGPRDATAKSQAGESPADEMVHTDATVLPADEDAESHPAGPGQQPGRTPEG